MRVLAKSRHDGHDHREQDQGCGRPEKKSENEQNPAKEFRQGCEKPPHIWHEADSEIGHSVSDVRPGCLTAGKLLPTEHDEYGADANAADQESEIGMLGQRLEHETV